MDEKIRRLFANRMELILRQRKDEIARVVGRERSKSAARGMLQSTASDQLIAKVYVDKYDELCNEAWSQLHRFAVTIGVKPDDSLIGELRKAFDEVMKPLADEFLANIREYNTMGYDIITPADASFLISRDIIGNEIELFSSNTAMQVSESPGTPYIQNYSFSGPIGAFQQGDHSTATVTQNIDTSGLEALRSALDSMLGKFVDHHQLGPLLVEAKTEADKPQPQLSFLRGLLSGIKACIGLVRDGKELFQEVERAALECGI